MPMMPRRCAQNMRACADAPHAAPTLDADAADVARSREARSVYAYAMRS